MIINHNIAALNTHRQLGSANNAQMNSMEKLSSGLRINKASDDAAGLSISEKMRGQIRGLEQASSNAQDGISLMQTAEGALNETHDILQRMRELSVQSANDTNTDTDRKELQKEVNALASEISRIGNDTEFNTKTLLDGKFEATFQIGANENQNLSLEINDMRGFSLGMTGDAELEVTTANTATAAGTYTISGDTTSGLKLLDSTGTQVGQSADGKIWEDMATTPATTMTFTEVVSSGEIKTDGTNATATASFTNGGLQTGEYSVDFTSATDVKLLDSNNKVIATSSDQKTFISVEDPTKTVLTTTAVIGADTTLKVEGVNISSQEAANTAITKINDAIQTVSSERSKLGANQNRLEHTINNLGTSAENLTAAESRIRDVDMAKEMMEQTKNSILSQAAQAMLAQANQQPQAVLQLLR